MARACRVRRAAVPSILAALLSLGAAHAAKTTESAAPLPFPPPPPATDLVPCNDAERAAGATILEDVTQLAGEVRLGAFRVKGSTTRWRRVRHAVFDASGAEALTRHAFFGTRGARPVAVLGRTISPDGTVHPLDPARDIKTMRERGAEGAAVHAVIFPRVEPGAVLDLSWVESSDDLPELELVPLQSPLPIRSERVTSTGLLLAHAGWSAWSGPTGLPNVSYHWVPFFVGPAPERAHATVEPDFSLTLTLSEVPPLPDEPLAPPLWRTSWMLGLMPADLSAKKRDAAAEWKENLILFGPGQADVTGAPATVSRDIDASSPLVVIDELGLQPPPEWTRRADWMAADRATLRTLHGGFHSFLADETGLESEAAVAVIAPADLPWRERAHRLFRHARSRVRPDLTAPARKDLSEMLSAGSGGSHDMALYLSRLLRQAGIPARMMLVLARTGVPYQPVFPTWSPFQPLWYVQVGPEGEPPLHVDPGDPNEPFGALASAAAGGLAFREPSAPSAPLDAWEIVSVPLDAETGSATEIAMSAALPAPGASASVALQATMRGGAARAFRVSCGPARGGETAEQAAERARTALGELAERWTGSAPGAPERPAIPADADTPVVARTEVPWAVEVTELGDGRIVPALPPGPVLANPFKADHRHHPMWLQAGTYRLVMTWRLPPGATLAEPVPPRRVEGPRGLRLDLDVQVVEDSESEPPGEAVRTQLEFRVPQVVPASEYAEAQRFFDALEATAQARLVIASAPPP